MIGNMDYATTYTFMYLEINLMAIILVAIILYKTQGISKMVAQRNFAMSIYSAIVFFASDTVFVMMHRGIFEGNKIVYMVSKSAYFLSTTVMCYFWFVYFEHMQGSPFVENRRRVRIASCLVWIMAILVIVNIFTGILFYVDKDGNYCRGPLFLIQYFISYMYVLITCLRALIGIFDKHKKAIRPTLIRLALFPLAPGIAGIVQFIYPNLPLACATLSLAILLLYMNSMDQVIAVDPLTKLGNRKHFLYRYEQWLENENSDSMYLMMIDANKFKSINDTYGHIEGDAALVRISEAMRMACAQSRKKSSCIRFGGDEFLIMIWTSDENEVHRIGENVISSLKVLNDEANAPYDLTVCIGVSKADKTRDIKDIIEEADMKLYEEKRKV